MWPNMGKEKEPDWVAVEREHFDKWRDLNKVRLSFLLAVNSMANLK